MDLKRFKDRTVLTAAVAAAAYSLIAGKGPFNKTRFREQHDVLSRYVDGNYPDCSYAPITMHGRGWASKIRRHGRIIKFVYFSKGADGHYIFTEADHEIK